MKLDRDKAKSILSELALIVSTRGSAEIQGLAREAEVLLTRFDDASTTEVFRSIVALLQATISEAILDHQSQVVLDYVEIFHSSLEMEGRLGAINRALWNVPGSYAPVHAWIVEYRCLSGEEHWAQFASLDEAEFECVLLTTENVENALGSAVGKGLFEDGKPLRRFAFVRQGTSPVTSAKIIETDDLESYVRSKHVSRGG